MGRNCRSISIRAPPHSRPRPAVRSPSPPARRSSSRHVSTRPGGPRSIANTSFRSGGCRRGASAVEGVSDRERPRFQVPPYGLTAEADRDRPDQRIETIRRLMAEGWIEPYATMVSRLEIRRGISFKRASAPASDCGLLVLTLRDGTGGDRRWSAPFHASLNLVADFWRGAPDRNTAAANKKGAPWGRPFPTSAFANP